MRIIHNLLFILLIFVLSINLVSADLEQDLLAYYDFNGDTVDGTGNGNDANNFGAVLTVNKNNISNEAYFFDGIDDYMINPIDSNLDFEPNQIGSWHFWAKRNDTLTTTEEKFFQGGFANGFTISKISNTHIRVRFDWTEFTDFSYSLDDNWHFFSIIKSATNYTLYIDGSKIGGTATYSGDITQDTGYDTYINGNGGQYFKGTIDEIRIYNRTLNTTEINSLFACYDSCINTSENNIPVVNQLTVNYIQDNNKYEVNASAFDSEGDSIEFEYRLYYGNGSLYQNGYHSRLNISRVPDFDLTQNIINSGLMRDNNLSTFGFANSGNAFIKYSYNKSSLYTGGVFNLSVFPNITNEYKSFDLTGIGCLNTSNINIQIGWHSLALSQYNITCGNFTNRSIYSVGNMSPGVNSISELFISQEVQEIVPDSTLVNILNHSAYDSNMIISVRAFDGLNYSEWVNHSYDSINPSLNTTEYIEINSYKINFSSLIECNDLNLSYCIVTTDEGNSFSFTNTSYTFETNGNHTYNVTAVDIHGNMNISLNNIIYINPTIYIYFDNPPGTPLQDILIDNVLYSDYYSFNLSDISGNLPYNHTFEFSKDGYVSTNNTLLLTNNVSSNITYDADLVIIYIKVYDFYDNSLQLIFNLTMTNLSNSYSEVNVLDGEFAYNITPHDDVEFILSGIGYSTAKLYNTILGNSIINLTAFLTPANSTDVVSFFVKELGTETPLNNVNIEVQQLQNGSFVTIVMAQSDDNGQSYVEIDITKDYKFVFSKDNYVTATSNAIPGTTSYTVNLNPSGSSFTYIDDISYMFLPVSTLLYTPNNYTFEAFISGTSITSMLYTITDQNGNLVYNATSTNPTGTTFLYDFELLNSTSYTELVQNITYIRNGITNSYTKLHKVDSLTNSSIMYYLQEYKQDDSEESQLWRWLVMVISFGGTLLIARTAGTGVKGMSLLGIMCIGFFTFVGWIPIAYFGAITIGALILLMGVLLQ